VLFRSGAAPSASGEKRAAAPKNASLDQRLDYYKKKYGDSYTAPAGEAKPEKKSIIKKVLGIFRKKKD